MLKIYKCTGKSGRIYTQLLTVVYSWLMGLWFYFIVCLSQNLYTKNELVHRNKQYFFKMGRKNWGMALKFSDDLAILLVLSKLLN